MVFGYLDPGTGSLILQLLVGGLAGLAAFVRFRWGTIKSRLSREEKIER
jgi:hypothetical protein